MISKDVCRWFFCPYLVLCDCLCERLLGYLHLPEVTFVYLFIQQIWSSLLWVRQCARCWGREGNGIWNRHDSCPQDTSFFPARIGMTWHNRHFPTLLRIWKPDVWFILLFSWSIKWESKNSRYFWWIKFSSLIALALYDLFWPHWEVVFPLASKFLIIWAANTYLAPTMRWSLWENNGKFWSWSPVFKELIAQ